MNAARVAVEQEPEPRLSISRVDTELAGLASKGCYLARLRTVEQLILQLDCYLTRLRRAARKQLIFKLIILLAGACLKQ